MARASLMGFVAWRGLAQSPLATGLMILAVAVGVAFQIPNSANLDGYKEEALRQGVSAGFGDVRGRSREGRQIRDASTVAAQLRTQPHVTTAVPMVLLAGAVSAGSGFEEAVIVGIDHDVRQPYVLLRGEHLPRLDACVEVGRQGSDGAGHLRSYFHHPYGFERTGHENAAGNRTAGDVGGLDLNGVAIVSHHDDRYDGASRRRCDDHHESPAISCLHSCRLARSHPIPMRREAASLILHR
jgi:hypothetical protein